jgi:hypothetical protein
MFLAIASHMRPALATQKLVVLEEGRLRNKCKEL